MSRPIAGWRWRPLIAGFAHLDPIRAYRQLNFAPESIATLATQFFSVAVALVLVVTMRDFRPILWGLVAQSAGYVVILAPVGAPVAMKLAFSKEYAARLAAFAWAFDDQTGWCCLPPARVIASRSAARWACVNSRSMARRC